MSEENNKSKIVALINLQEGKMEQFYQLADELIENSRKETGIVTYKLFKSTENDNEVLFFEEYADQEAMQQHSKSAHFNKFMEAVKPLLAGEPRLEMF